MRAFVYCRVSTKEQSSQDHYSLDNQEQRCRDYIKMKGWKLTKLRKDVASGKNDQRGGFQDLKAHLREQKIDVVLVYRLDRLSRNVRDIYDFLDTIKDSNVAFVSVTEGFDTTTAMGRAMLGVAAVFAQLTREMISENTRDGLLRRREAGYAGGDLTNVYGYRYCTESRLLVIEEKEAAVVQQIFDWYTDNRWGTTKIAQMLNLQKIPSKMGGKWSSVSLRHMLNNPLLCGKLRVEDRVIDGNHAGIISVEQFELAQEIRSSYAKYSNRSQQSKYLLSGLARCGSCGRSLVAHTIYQGKNKTPYTFYHHHRSNESDACPGLSKSVPMVDTAVIAQIEEFSRTQALDTATQGELIQRLAQQNAPKAQERDKLLVELQQMDVLFTGWADRLDAGKIDEEQFERQNQRLRERKGKLQQRLSALEAELGQGENLQVTLTEVRQALQDFGAVWQELEHEEQREVLRLLVEELKVHRTHIVLKLLFLEPVQVPLSCKKKPVAPDVCATK